MTPDTSHFGWSDAWLFLAIGYANDKGESSLARVIGVADAIQHAVLTWEEVDGGLFRLGKAGYVIVRDGKVGLTRQGRTILEGLQKEDSARQAKRAHSGYRCSVMDWARSHWRTRPRSTTDYWSGGISGGGEPVHETSSSNAGWRVSKT